MYILKDWFEIDLRDNLFLTSKVITNKQEQNMGQIIDARQTRAGLRFRVLSTNTDSYVTVEMTEEELRNYLLIYDVDRAIRGHLVGIDFLVNRTKERGSSDPDDKAGLRARWRKQECEKHERVFPTDRDNKKITEAVKVLKAAFPEAWRDIEELISQERRRKKPV